MINERLVTFCDFSHSADMRINLFAGLLFGSFLFLLPRGVSQGNETSEYDIVIYGGTSAGLVAGFQAIKSGKSVLVIEPTDRVGGLTTGGLGQTDIGNKQVIGGMSREFYQRIADHYAKAASWKWQEKEEYESGGQSKTADGEDTMWTFEPSAAKAVFDEWIAETGLEVVFQERLNRESGVEIDGGRIAAIQMESGRQFSGKIFIDATYEGDLMAAAGVSYTVGRESVDKYGESLNGVQTRQAKKHNFQDGVDPYRVAGDPDSGLLPFLDPDGPGEEGAGDERVQAYCFRMCLTDHPENRLPFHQPEGYDEEWYELLFRNFEAGSSSVPWINSRMPNRKTDTNNRNGFSTDFIGQNYAYPEASYEQRERIVARHLLYQQGLVWTLENHPRVPKQLREEVSKWGMCKDEFVEGNGWQEQLYIREARRMVSDFVMTQRHCQQEGSVEDSVGMGAYTMDSHNVQRYVTEEGWAKNEGDVQVGGFPPYPISYRSIVPAEAEAQNLLVPVCLSASHIAFGSIRMEPVFMVLGQSAATAASMAIDQGVAVQRVEYTALRKQLETDGQVLFYTPPAGWRQKPRYTKLEGLSGIVVDDVDARLTGDWSLSSVQSGVNEGYYHDGDVRNGGAVAEFTAEFEQPGEYEVQVAYVSNPNRATNVPVEVIHAAGRETVLLNQREKPKIEGGFASVGKFRFEGSGSVTIANRDTNGYTVIDAVRWLPVE